MPGNTLVKQPRKFPNLWHVLEFVGISVFLFSLCISMIKKYQVSHFIDFHQFSYLSHQAMWQPVPCIWDSFWISVYFFVCLCAQHDEFTHFENGFTSIHRTAEQQMCTEEAACVLQIQQAWPCSGHCTRLTHAAFGGQHNCEIYAFWLAQCIFIFW